MDYFSLLNLKKEPFSNSPDPEFFFGTNQHMECLQKVELAIRLRQGLCVVVGDIGTGKTTLCRQILRRLDKEDTPIISHLILDPEFSSPLEFLTTIVETLGISGQGQNTTERQLKEAIKDFLFIQGVDKKKIVTLMIDEGQRLPGFCLEIMRELLNFETNDSKLLQIVIFAQEEFFKTLQARPNFTDRIAVQYHLQPLNFTDTRQMIRFRVNQAKGKHGNAPRLFGFWALLAIYWVTGGYPRKIVMLCSKTLIALIVRNGSQVTGSLVLACAKRFTIGRGPVKPLLAGTAVLGIAALFFLFFEQRQTLPPQVPAQPQMQKPTTASSTEKTLSPLSKQSSTLILAKNRSDNKRYGPKDPHELAPPHVLGRLQVNKGDTISKMIARVYGRFAPGTLKLLLEANPGLHDMRNLKVDTTVTFPFPATLFPNNEPGAYWVRLTKGANFEKMYNFIRSLDENTDPATRLVPTWTWSGGTRFTVLIEESFPSLKKAEEKIEKLRPDLKAGAEVFHEWEDETVFLVQE
ncbi:MAG: AAA family ATPase [Desulfobulbaceae bacterium]|nr:AAA family ATPase [Desulfobulbaceae bacterium]